MAIQINKDETLGIEYIDPEDILDEYSINEIKSMENGNLIIGLLNCYISDYIHDIVRKLITINSYYKDYNNGIYDNDPYYKGKIAYKVNIAIEDLSAEYDSWKSKSLIWKYIDKGFDELINDVCDNNDINYEEIISENKTLDRR